MICAVHIEWSARWQFDEGRGLVAIKYRSAGSRCQFPWHREVSANSEGESRYLADADIGEL